MISFGRNHRIGYLAKCQITKKLKGHTPGAGYFRMCELEEKK